MWFTGIDRSRERFSFYNLKLPFLSPSLSSRAVSYPPMGIDTYISTDILSDIGTSISSTIHSRQSRVPFNSSIKFPNSLIQSYFRLPAIHTNLVGLASACIYDATHEPELVGHWCGT